MDDTVLLRSLYLAAAKRCVAPTIVGLIGILMNHAEANALRREFNQRFDDLRDLWRAELHRVEEVLDARLKHLEEKA